MFLNVKFAWFGPPYTVTGTKLDCGVLNNSLKYYIIT